MYEFKTHYTFRVIHLKFIMLLVLFVMYDTILDAIIWITRNSFEWIELALEAIIEHFFHTNHHQSEIIVVYLFLVFALLGLYLFWKALPRLSKKLQNKMLAIWMQQKSNFSSQWQTLTAMQKVLLTALAGTGFFCFLI